jgi:hypothetical protein
MRMEDQALQVLFVPYPEVRPSTHRKSRAFTLIVSMCRSATKMSRVLNPFGGRLRESMPGLP